MLFQVGFSKIKDGTMAHITRLVQLEDLVKTLIEPQASSTIGAISLRCKCSSPCVARRPRQWETPYAWYFTGAASNPRAAVVRKQRSFAVRSF